MKNPYQINVGSLDLQVYNVLSVFVQYNTPNMSQTQACHTVTQIIEMVEESEKRPLVCTCTMYVLCV